MNNYVTEIKKKLAIYSSKDVSTKCFIISCLIVIILIKNLGVASHLNQFLCSSVNQPVVHDMSGLGDVTVK